MRSKDEWEKIYKDKSTPWDTNSPDNLLVKLVEKNKIKPCKVIDFGCGTGNEAIFLAKKGFSVTAIDISKNAIREAKRRAKESGVKCKFLAKDIIDISTKEKYNFGIDRCCFHFIGAEKRSVYLKNLSSILKPDSFFILTVSSDKDTVPGPNQFSRKEIREFFSQDFKILRIRLTKLKKHNCKPFVYVCLMKKK